MNTIHVKRVGQQIFVVLDGESKDEVLFDPIEFAVGAQSRATNLFIFTCGCGVSGCAGWHEGFVVTTRENTVEWDNLDPENFAGYILPKYVFDRQQYIAARHDALKYLYEIVSERESIGLNPHPDLRGYKLFEFYTKEELDKALLSTIEWQVKRDDANINGWPDYSYSADMDGIA